MKVGLPTNYGAFRTKLPQPTGGAGFLNAGSALDVANQGTRSARHDRGSGCYHGVPDFFVGAMVP